MIGNKLMFIIVALLQLFVLAKCQCPDVFRTYTNGSTGEKIGLIRIPNAPKGVTLHIRVILSVAQMFPPAYRGRLDLANSLEESVEAIAEGKPLYYRVRFPIQNPIPSVTNITFNDEVYCTGPRAPGLVRTTFFMEHSFNQPEIKDPVIEQWLEDIKSQNSKAPATTESSPTENVEPQETTAAIPAESISTTDEEHTIPDATTPTTETPDTETPKTSELAVESESATTISVEDVKTDIVENDSATTIEAETVTDVPSTTTGSHL